MEKNKNLIMAFVKMVVALGVFDITLKGINFILKSPLLIGVIIGAVAVVLFIKKNDVKGVKKENC